MRLVTGHCRYGVPASEHSQWSIRRTQRERRTMDIEHNDYIEERARKLA